MLIDGLEDSTVNRRVGLVRNPREDGFKIRHCGVGVLQVFCALVMMKLCTLLITSQMVISSSSSYRNTII